MWRAELEFDGEMVKHKTCCTKVEPCGTTEKVAEMRNVEDGVQEESDVEVGE
jgi:hypothetical protein